MSYPDDTPPPAAGPAAAPSPLAGAAMALSSVSVVSNALLLKTWKPQTPPQDDAP